jgi:hypothetical protein
MMERERKANCIRASPPAVSVFWWASARRLDNSWQNLAPKKQDLTSRHVVYCVYIYVLFDCYIDRINHVMDERVLTHRRKSDRPLFLFLNFAPGVFIYSLMYSRKKKNIVFLPCLTCVWICTKLWERCFGDNNSRDDITHLRLCHSLFWWPWLSDSRWRLWTTYMGNQNDHSSVPVRLDPFSFVAWTAQRRWQSCRNPTHTRVTGFRVFLLFFFWRLKLVGGGMMTDNATQCRVCIPVKWYWKSLTVHCVKLWEEKKYLKKISEKATNGPFSSIIRMCRLYIPPACPTQNLLGAFHVVSRGAAQTQHRASRPYGPRSAEDVCWNF